MKNSAFSLPVQERLATFTRYHAVTLFCLLLLAAALAFRPAAFAQDYRPVQAGPAFTQQELDQMLAPIALYADPLLSQVLMAATYPLEVVEAARWTRANPGLTGDRAVAAAATMDWDPSVKSLVAFPQILAMMDERLNWTEDLGDAFLAQEPQVMDSIQYLRGQAYAAGNLASDDRIRVNVQEQAYSIVPADPQVIYVPCYDPLIVYGTWRWPAYPPVRWAPWPGYYARPGAAVYARTVHVTVAPGFFFGAFDWRRHHVNVVNVNNYYYHPTVVVNHPSNVVNTAPGAWQHDPAHRGGVPYRDAALHQQSDRVSTAVETQPDFRRHDPSPRVTGVNQGNRTDARNANPRAEARSENRPDANRRELASPDAIARATPRVEIPNSRPEPASAAARQQPSATAQLGVPSSRQNFERQPGAFEGAGHGADARNPGPRESTGNQSVRVSQNNVHAQPIDNATAPRPSGNGSAPQHSGKSQSSGETQSQHK